MPAPRPAPATRRASDDSCLVSAASNPELQVRTCSHRLGAWGFVTKGRTAHWVRATQTLTGDLRGLCACPRLVLTQCSSLRCRQARTGRGRGVLGDLNDVTALGGDVEPDRSRVAFRGTGQPFTGVSKPTTRHLRNGIVGCGRAGVREGRCDDQAGSRRRARRRWCRGHRGLQFSCRRCGCCSVAEQFRGGCRYLARTWPGSRYRSAGHGAFQRGGDRPTKLLRRIVNMVSGGRDEGAASVDRHV